MDLGRPRSARPRVALTPFLVALGLIAAVLATLSSHQHERRAAEHEQRARASALAAELDAAVDAASARLSDLAVAVAVARDPERGAFDAMAGRIRSETPLATIGYILHLPQGRTDAFRRDRGVPILEISPLGMVGTSRQRPVHYPAVRASGPHLGLYAPGIDLVSRLVPVRAAVVQARASGTIRASSPMPIPAPLGQSALLVAPVGRIGYLVGILPYAQLVRDLRARVPAARFALSDGGIDLGDRPALERDAITRRLGVAGRTWTLTVDRPRAAVGATFAIAVIGLLLTLVVGLASRLGARRQRLAEAGRLAAEERSRQLAETSTDLLLIHDAAGRISYVSPACRELLGRAPADLLGSRPQAHIHPDDLADVGAALQQVAAGADTLAVTVRLRRGDGSWVWAEVRTRVLRDADGVAVEAHSTVRDVTERMAAKSALEEAESRFRSTFDEAPIGMAITVDGGRFQRVNRALGTMLGYAPGELEGRHVDEVTHPEDRALGSDGVRRMMDGESDTCRIEKRYLHANGRPVWADVSITAVRDHDGEPQFFLAQMQDITERRRYDAELRHLADHDPLTGLLNRRSFERELERHVGEVERDGARGAAIVLDLDHFKTINDTLGHGVGDELIARVAHALRARLRASDVLARLGGDEFAILLAEGGRDEAIEVAEGVLEAVRGQAVLASSGHARRVSASLGIALFTEHRRLTPDAMLVEADLAMYEAKEAGRDRYAVAEGTTVDGRVGGRISWADEIRDALAEDRFELHAQPIVDVPTGRIGQYELLLRMIAPDGGLIAPGAFLPVAERYDLIGKIDRWVVRRAIAMLAEAGAAGSPITAEVNLSGRSIGDPGLLALIERELREWELDPGRLIFEITETTAVANIPAAQDFAARLADLGCRFALDDFGAGFGSFFYLKHLPFDFLKIDGEFVRHSAENRTDQLVIQAVVDIARGLGKRTVAEQVGDEATMALLRRMGVDQAQGYFLGRPAPLGEWLARAGTPRAAV